MPCSEKFRPAESKCGGRDGLFLAARWFSALSTRYTTASRLYRQDVAGSVDDRRNGF